MLVELQLMAAEAGLTMDQLACGLALDLIFFGLFVGRKKKVKTTGSAERHG